MRSIAVGNRGHRIGQRKGLNSEAGTKGSVSSSWSSEVELTLRDIVP